MAGRRRDFVAPAFIHVDVDDLWAVAECYGVTVGSELRHRISEDALPRFRALFSEFDVNATFFVVGRDVVESPGYVKEVKALLDAGHEIANHSMTHRLDFRGLGESDLRDEINGCDAAVRAAFGRGMMGFRAPGYAASGLLTDVLQDLGYRYDGSLMASPFGGVFRWMDDRLTRRAGQLEGKARKEAGRGVSAMPVKTQYPLFVDGFKTLWPGPVGDAPEAVIRVPSAVAPGLRLPFQAGVCMRLGWPYFRGNLEAFRRVPGLPFVFLFHAADLADVSGSGVRFFEESKFFNTPVEGRLELARRFVAGIAGVRPVCTTEAWLR